MRYGGECGWLRGNCCQGNRNNFPYTLAQKKPANFSDTAFTNCAVVAAM